MKLYDAHNHLQDEWLAPHRPACLDLCTQRGVCGAVVNGTTEADWPEVAALAREYAWVQASYGLHPWFLAERTEAWTETLRQALLNDPRAAVGEIGLDRWKEPYDLADQRRVLESQWNLAVELDRPITVHCLNAWGALLDFLRQAQRAPRGFLLHAYGGAGELVPEFVRHGAYFSFNGYFLKSGKTETRQVFAELPLDRLLVETDAPAMPLPPERVVYALPEAEPGKPVNHPAHLWVTYAALAELRGMDLETLSVHVEANFFRLFGTDKTASG